MQNSKPLLVSDLVNTYKGINTSTITEPDATAQHAKNAAASSQQIQNANSNSAINDYADVVLANGQQEKTSNQKQRSSHAKEKQITDRESAVKNFTIIEESADEMENDQDKPKQNLNSQLDKK